MVKYQEVLHGSTSELYINGEREELVTKIEIKMTGDFEDSSFCGEYGTFPIYNGYAIEGTISGKKRNSTLENAIVEGYRTGEMPDITVISALGRAGNAGLGAAWCSRRRPWPTSRPRRRWSGSCPLRRSWQRIWRRSSDGEKI